MRRKKFFAVWLLALCTAFSSCTGVIEETGTQDISSVSTESVSGTEAEGSVTEITETPEETTETVSEMTETTDVSAADTEFADTETAEASSGTAETSQTESSRQTEQTGQTTTVTQKPPAEVVIPKIKMPQATGEKTVSGDNAELDYSFAEEGYVSAVYSGGASGAKIRIKCGDVQYDHDLSTGGKREFFPLMGGGSYSVKIYEYFSGDKYKLVAEGSFDVKIADGTKTYRYPNKYVDFNGSSACVKKAAEVCAGAADDVEKIALIFGYVTENIKYDKQLAATAQSGYLPYPDNTLSKGTGICFDYASLFAAMCRSQSIPARLVIGYAEPDIRHAWNEVYTDETGWITPELFLKKKGYNIADATFYAGSSDKEKIAAYISDEGNYSAVYRY